MTDLTILPGPPATRSTREPDEAAAIADLTFLLLADCHEKERRLSEQLRISVPEFRCLRWFRGARQLHVRELVERMSASPSRISRILADLEKDGLVTRTIDPDDRRGIVVVLTPKGVTFSEKLEERFTAIHREILAGIDPKIRGQIAESLSMLLASVTRWLRGS